MDKLFSNYFCIFFYIAALWTVDDKIKHENHNGTKCQHYHVILQTIVGSWSHMHEKNTTMRNGHSSLESVTCEKSFHVLSAKWIFKIADRMKP
jgi:hypothetical protein